MSPVSIPEPSKKAREHRKHKASSPGSVTRACNPSGGVKVMEHWASPRSRIVNGYCLACPFQAVSEWCGLGGGLGRSVPKAGGYRVRLASQSSDNLPLTAVEG
ncbi:conserved hypothetical protein [Ricinus communis]|uniref:Uncharacterized protein n=1 Tax=Ricinus communis TaxID=3988 RepID=B9RHY6_RICCO|nr:conserved hypothetical protein [Ricinus communis]